MAIGGVSVGQELLNVPMGDMIRSMALAIADAQWALDKSSMVVTELMSGQRLLRDLETGELLDKKGQRLIDEKGQPTGEPTIIDSLIYFGYTYDAQGNRIPAKMSMMELGFVPTFYQFVDTIIEVKISITINATTEAMSATAASTTDVANRAAYSYQHSGYWWGSGGGAAASASRGTTVTTSQVNAGFANRYNYTVEGASLLRTKLVPVPPPPVLEDRIRQLMEIEAQFRLDHPGIKNNVITLVKDYKKQ